jgi:hypothetical protein
MNLDIACGHRHRDCYSRTFAHHSARHQTASGRDASKQPVTPPLVIGVRIRKCKTLHISISLIWFARFAASAFTPPEQDLANPMNLVAVKYKSTFCQL